MRGALIYERENVARNQRFIDFFLDAAKQYGCKLNLVMVDELRYGAAQGGAFVSLGGAPFEMDFAVVRAMNPWLSEQLERVGVKVFNNALTSRVCNDKRRTAQYFMAQGLPMVKTAFFAPLNTPPFPFPLVLKAADGCGGRQVYLCRDMAQYNGAVKKLASNAVVAQPFLPTGGRDVRVYMLDGRVYQAMERYSDGVDFRSNFGIHGTARPYRLNAQLEQLAVRAVAPLKTAFVGVDFLFDESGTPFVNEMEDAVGTRMLYQFTSLKPVADYMRLIVDTLL